jgi:hypothetical protein
MSTNEQGPAQPESNPNTTSPTQPPSTSETGSTPDSNANPNATTPEATGSPPDPEASMLAAMEQVLDASPGAGTVGTPGSTSLDPDATAINLGGTLPLPGDLTVLGRSDDKVIAPQPGAEDLTALNLSDLTQVEPRRGAVPGQEETLLVERPPSATPAANPAGVLAAPVTIDEAAVFVASLAGVCDAIRTLEAMKITLEAQVPRAKARLDAATKSRDVAIARLAGERADADTVTALARAAEDRAIEQRGGQVDAAMTTARAAEDAATAQRRRIQDLAVNGETTFPRARLTSLERRAELVAAALKTLKALREDMDPPPDEDEGDGSDAK